MTRRHLFGLIGAAIAARFVPKPEITAAPVNAEPVTVASVWTPSVTASGVTTTYGNTSVTMTAASYGPQPGTLYYLNGGQQ